MPEPKLTPVQIGEHFRAAYQSVSGKLHAWEQAKAELLVNVGRECLELVRDTLEPLPDHDLALRKSERAKLVKEIEGELPADCDGIGVPQVNRWIRWAGVCEVLALEGPAPWGLKQSHLMVLETFIEHNEARCDFRLKPSWKDAIEGMRTAVQSCVNLSWSAKELDAVLDETAIPAEQKPVVEVAANPPVAPEKSPTATVNVPATPVELQVLAPAATAEIPKPQAAAPRLPGKSPTAPAPSPTVSPSPSPSHSPRATTSPAPGTNTNIGPSPKELADQAFQLLQRDDILAGVFRRDWDPAKVLSLVDNLIRGCGEESSNLLGLARAYHRLRPFVLTFFEEYADENKFKLRKKEHPEPPTLEQLAPLGELQTT